MERILGSRSLIFTLVFLLAVSFGQTARGAEPAPRPVAVQTKPLVIPVAKPDRSYETQLVTVFLVVKQRSDVKTACYWMPRIQDRLMQTFHARPLTLQTFTSLHKGTVDSYLHQAVQKAMNGKDIVTGVHAIPGIRIPKDTAWAKSTKIEKCKSNNGKKGKK